MSKRSLVLSGHGTSVALEPEFWHALERIAGEGGETLPQLVERVDSARDPARSLASALRVLALRETEKKIVPPSASFTAD
ncbi:ribbon-helix-helix domain-containing protein [Acetobacteraceae bacterium KSS8]|uniref:Ribbon-helix-helix domain-containing protein n=1 Tax=Endosaccharibacter trunci TaxID=2812733 RepID=A0ABT1W5I7_9PROT|nr:ribbon-helix-helix domain-containing protein [Acetobacteraceae bacterium KSS8]